MKHVYTFLLIGLFVASFSSYAGINVHMPLVLTNEPPKVVETEYLEIIEAVWGDSSELVTSSVKKINNEIRIGKLIHRDENLIYESIDFSFSAKYSEYEEKFSLISFNINAKEHFNDADRYLICIKVLETIKEFLNSLLNGKTAYKDGVTVHVDHFIITKVIQHMSDEYINNELYSMTTDGYYIWATRK